MADLSGTTSLLGGLLGAGVLLVGTGLILNAAERAYHGYEEPPRKKKQNTNYFGDYDIYNYHEPKRSKKKSYSDDLLDWQNYV